jgi:hypothetical protein
VYADKTWTDETEADILPSLEESEPDKECHEAILKAKINKFKNKRLNSVH